MYAIGVRYLSIVVVASWVVSASCSEKLCKGKDRYLGCFADRGLTYSNYLWVRVRIRQECSPDGYTTIQVGHSEISLHPVPQPTSVDKGKKSPYWLSRQKYSPVFQVRILEDVEKIDQRWVIHIKDNKSKAIDRYFNDVKVLKDIPRKRVQDEYFDFKIRYGATGLIELFLNGELFATTEEEGEVMHDALNLFEVFHSGHISASSTRTEYDLISLESYHYIQPFIAHMLPGGFLIGSSITIGAFLSESLWVNFTIKGREAEGALWSLEIAESTVSLDIPFELYDDDCNNNNEPEWKNKTVEKFDVKWENEVREIKIGGKLFGSGSPQINYVNVPNRRVPE